MCIISPCSFLWFCDSRCFVGINNNWHQETNMGKSKKCGGPWEEERCQHLLLCTLNRNKWTLNGFEPVPHCSSKQTLYLLYFFTECMAYISDNTCDLCSYLSLLSERVHAHIAKLLRVFVCISHLWGQTMIEWTLSRSVEACLPSFIALIVQGPWTSPTETMACVWTLKLTFEIIYFKRTMQYVSQLPSRCLVIVFFWLPYLRFSLLIYC